MPKNTKPSTKIIADSVRPQAEMPQRTQDTEKQFNAARLKTRGYRFDREDANARKGL